MPKLTTLFLRHALVGFGVSAVFVVGLLAFNIANIAHLVMHTPDGPLALALLWVLCGSSFAAVQIGIAVMRDDDDDTPPRGGRRDAIPVRVERSDRKD